MAGVAYGVNESLLLCIHKGFASSLITDLRTAKVPQSHAPEKRKPLLKIRTDRGL